MFETAPPSPIAAHQPMPQGQGVPHAGPAADIPESRASAGAPTCPGAGLAGLVEQARITQARLGGQPLPIANRDMLLIRQLLGG